MSKKKVVPKGKKITMVCDFNLNDKEKSEKATLAATLAEEAAALEDEKKQSNDIFNTQIRAKEDAMYRHLTDVKAGVRKEEVEVIEVKNFDKNKMEYWFDGEINNEREMTDEERQTEMDLRTEKKGSRKNLKVVEQPKADNDVEQVRREESSAKSKWNSVDGPRATT